MMTLGMIVDATADGIRQAAGYGLKAAEFCYNDGNDPDALIARLPEIKAACEECGVRVMSIGRWASD
nr:hypothetical protein [Clostridia bacterium]